MNDTPRKPQYIAIRWLPFQWVARRRAMAQTEMPAGGPEDINDDHLAALGIWTKAVFARSRQIQVQLSLRYGAVLLAVAAVVIAVALVGCQEIPAGEFARGDSVVIKSTGVTGAVVRVFIQDRWEVPYREYSVRYFDEDGNVQHVTLSSGQMELAQPKND